jgi:hypothetical protein
MIHDLHHVCALLTCATVLYPYRPHPQVPLGMSGMGSCAIYLNQKKALLCTGPFGTARCGIKEYNAIA